MNTFCNCCGKPLNNSDNFDDELCHRCETKPNTDSNGKFDDEDGFKLPAKDLSKLLFNGKTPKKVFVKR